MEIIEFFTIMKSKLYIVILAAIACAAAVGIYSWHVMENEYTASTDLYILARGNEITDDQQLITQSDMNASQQMANDIAILASSAKVKKQTANALGLETLDGYEISVKSASTNRVITVSVTGKQPEAAALVANELGRQLSETATDIMELEAVNIINEAETPDQPSGPKRIQYTAIAFIVGLLVSMMVVIALDLFSMTFKTSEDAEETLGVPVVGRLPKVKK